MTFPREYRVARLIHCPESLGCSRRIRCIYPPNSGVDSGTKEHLNMHKQRQGVALALLLTALPLSACSDNGGNNTKASSVTTVTLTSPTSSSSSSAPSQPTQPETTPANPSAEPTEQPAVTQTQTQADGVIGYTGAPGFDHPHLLNKTISSCGNPQLHETGTTFFTDGTSGWTQHCAAQMANQRTVTTQPPQVGPSSGEIQSWWMGCISSHDEQYCRDTDPYQ